MTKEEQIKKECDKLAEVLIQKNRDYGDAWSRSPYLVKDLDPGTVIWVRVSDKLERLRSLLWNENNPNVASEPLADTVRDIAGYCVGWLCNNAQKNEETPKELPLSRILAGNKQDRP